MAMIALSRVASHCLDIAYGAGAVKAIKAITLFDFLTLLGQSCNRLQVDNCTHVYAPVIIIRPLARLDKSHVSPAME
jgi:hypothetical protein